MNLLILSENTNPPPISVTHTTHHQHIRGSALLLGLFILVSNVLYSQGSGSGLRRQGDLFYDQGQYRSALRTYRQGGLENSTDKELRLRIGVCLYEINDVDAALRMFQSLINEGKTDPIVYYHTGRCYQAKKLFPEAISLYKRFLQRSKSNDLLRSWVKDEIIRCSNGSRLKFADELAYVENAGTAINTQFAEFGVRTSPTTIDRIYFNSDRDDIARGKRSNGNVDIYGTTLINGRWSPPAPLPAHINSPGYEEVFGFSSNGQILYFFSMAGNQISIRTDTFSNDSGKVYSGIFEGPFKPNLGDADMYLFNDTICLYAANIPGGYGGYDLYISILKKDKWTEGVNLGPAINSFYNERYPFLTRDGLTLYYSSDNLESTGGYDIFSSSFDTISLSWRKSFNPGFPINSPLDDQYMVLSPDGMTAYLTSNRKEGYGETDIYRVFFKHPVEAHRHTTSPPTFYHSLLQQGQDLRTPSAPVSDPVVIKEYYVSHLFFDENADILTPQNTKKLDILANLLLIYPKINAELSCFELPSGQRTFNLYFSIKKAEKAAEYLTKKGIHRNRIILKGYGASFPLVVKPAASLPSPVYQKLNQRLEIKLHYFADEPVIILVENLQVPQNLLDARGAKFSALRDQLYYSIQIASITQILQNPNLESEEELFIEVDNKQGNYLYMAGLLPTYKEAEKMMSRMMDLGFPDARIIPYVNGLRLSGGDVLAYAELYPDLHHYLQGTGK